jgi:hypothetical protein
MAEMVPCHLGLERGKQEIIHRPTAVSSGSLVAHARVVLTLLLSFECAYSVC